MADAILVLADGSVFRGRNFGARGTTFGEMCFNTGLTGYQEVLTDPSYHGQIVAMTYPHQGNYGLNNLDEEAPRPWVRGFVVREVTTQPSSWRSQESLPAYLERHNVVGIEGIDTRRLTRILRSQGAMTAGITTEDLDESSFLEQVRSAPVLEGRDLVAEVTPDAWFDADVDELRATGDFAAVSFEPDPRVDGAKIAALDLGMKKNILRCLVGMGARTRVYGGKSSSKDILDWAPDGVFVSNGPGDPAAVGYAITTVKNLIGKRPIFGICLGHQILSITFGARTHKMPFGHHGANHPVRDLLTREAFTLYFQKLAEQGLLLVHISNRFLDLAPVVANVAAGGGHATRISRGVQPTTTVGATAGEWIVLARREEELARFAWSQPPWVPLEVDPEVDAWTDDFTNIVQVLRWEGYQVLVQ